MPWNAPTLPWVAVAFHAPAFSETGKDWAALDILVDLTFGPTSDLYKRLVEDEQKVDRSARLGSVERRPGAAHRLRAREEAGGRRPTSATRS